jgi:hypothetical protein
MESQMTFPSQLAARQFLIDKIVDQAGRTDMPLSNVEERMLQLNLDRPESAAGIPVEVLEDAGHEYEGKIARLLQAAYSRDGRAPEEQEKYREAIRVLKDTDHYILIIAADAIPRRKGIGTYAIYIIIALAVVAMVAALQLWTHGR